MTNSIQKKFRVSSTQLLYQSCPYQAITLFVFGPFLDGLLTNKNVFAFNYTPQVLVRRNGLCPKPHLVILLCIRWLCNLYVFVSFQAFIVLSCLISISVNFSTFLVIGKTSAVTYQVLGHLKTCLVLTFGYVLLHDPFSWRNILGILVAVVGMVLYSYYCNAESQQQKASEASTQLSQVLYTSWYVIIVSYNSIYIFAAKDSLLLLLLNFFSLNGEGTSVSISVTFRLYVSLACTKFHIGLWCLRSNKWPSRFLYFGWKSWNVYIN